MSDRDARERWGASLGSWHVSGARSVARCLLAERLGTHAAG